jgi:NAD-dependent deacetylase
LNDLQTAAHWLRGAERVVVFTGAGISAESGIATFRDADGFWQRFPPEQFATWDGLLELSMHNPQALADFFLELLGPIAIAVPNPGHSALAKLEQRCQDKFVARLSHKPSNKWFNDPLTVITQNVDGLHQQAGSRNVKEIHGTLFKIVSEDRQWLGDLSRLQLAKVVETLTKAKAGGFKSTRLEEAVEPMLGLGPEGYYRPNLVLFGDGMNEPDWSDSLAAARSCDVFLTVGTSGEVFPAAMLPHEARANGAKCIAIDPEEQSCDLWLQGQAGNILPKLIQSAFAD